MNNPPLIRDAGRSGTSPNAGYRGPVLASALVVLAVLFGVAPLLDRIEFCRTLENLNVASAIEARRDGHWLVPTLEGQPRTKKPPLTAWITAAAIRASTLDAMSSRDAAVREAAQRRLAWEARLPALLAACGMLVATAVLGTYVGGARLGAYAAAALAGTYVFLQHAQVATTDVQLAAWVTIANAMFARAVLNGKRWSGGLAAGFAVGVAFMCKGPVAVAQTVLPVACFCAWDRLARRAVGRQQGGGASTKRLAPIACGTLLALLVVLPWPIAVLRGSLPGQWSTWFNEVTGNDAPQRFEPWFQYLLLFPLALFPWTLFAGMGLWVTALDSLRAARRQPAPTTGDDSPDPGRSTVPRRAFLLFLVAVPLVVMSGYKDKKVRYLLPMAPPAAVLGAWALLACAGGGEREHGWPAARAAHLAGVASVAVGLPIAGGLGIVAALRTTGGEPWYGFLFALAASLAGLLIVAAAVRWRGPAALVGATLAAMLLANVLFVFGYVRSDAARAPLKPVADVVWAKYPDAAVYDALPGGERASVDLSIYLNRVTPSLEPVRLSSMGRGDVPRVAVYMRRARDREPPPALSADWRPLLEYQRGSERWVAYVLPRAGDPR